MLGQQIFSAGATLYCWSRHLLHSGGRAASPQVSLQDPERGWRWPAPPTQVVLAAPFTGQPLGKQPPRPERVLALFGCRVFFQFATR